MATNGNNLLTIGSSKLGYERTGQGPDLLFLHGWPLHRATWRHLVANLADSTCHTLDFAGCGTSETPSNVGVSFRGHVEDTVEVITQLDLDGVVLVGQDSGGLIARMVAARLPERVAGLVLIGTEIPGRHPKLIDQLKMLMKIPGSAAVTRRALKTPALAKNERLLGSLFWDRDLIEQDFRTEVLDPLLAKPERLDRQLDILSSYSHELVDELEQVHHAITCPTLLVWGEDDLFFPPAIARTMLDQFAGPTRFEVVPKARLLVHEEHPKRVADLCREFIHEHGIAVPTRADEHS